MLRTIFKMDKKGTQINGSEDKKVDVCAKLYIRELT